MAALKSSQKEDTQNTIDELHKTPIRLTKMNTYDPGESTCDPLNQNKIGYSHEFTLKKALTSRSCDFNQQIVQGNFVFNYKPSSENNSLTRHSIDFVHSQTLSLDPSKKIFTSQVLSPKVTLPKQQGNDTSQKNNLQEKTEEDSTNEHIQDHPSSGDSVSPQEQYPIKKFNFKNPIETIDKEENDDFGIVQANHDDFQNNEADEELFHVDDNLFVMNKEHSKTSESEIGQIIFYKKSQFSRKEIQLIKPNKIQSKNEDQLDSSASKDDNQSENDESEGERQNGVEDSLPNTVQVRIKNKEKKFSTIVSEEEGSNASPKKSYDKIGTELTPAQRRKSQLSAIDTQRFKDALEKSKSNSKPAQNTPKTPLTPVDKLKLMGTVARTLSRLQVNQVNRIESSEQLDKEMLSIRQNSSFRQDNLNSGQKHHNEMDIALNQLRMIEMLTDLAERGHPQDVQSMISILRKDPKQYSYIIDISDRQMILNTFLIGLIQKIKIAHTQPVKMGT